MEFESWVSLASQISAEVRARIDTWKSPDRVFGARFGL